MKQFLKTKTITHNLMAFTGFKSVLVFSALVDGPKSYKELTEIVHSHPYLKEKISVDSLRIYINTLQSIGCQIEKSKIDGITKFFIINHPFNLRFDDKQIKSILKIYNAISKSIEVEDLVSLQQFFDKISNYVENEKLKIKLKNLSPLNNIDKTLIDNLVKHARDNSEIVVSYNSANSGIKNITIIIDKVYINNGKLYISGFNSEYNDYSSFLVSKIIKIVSINLKNKTLDVPQLTVGYKYENDYGEKLELISEETLIKSEGNVDFVEIKSKNKFDIMQRIMILSRKCTVLYPEDFRNFIIANLKKMKEGYFEK